MNYHDYKQECRKKYGDPNYIYLNRYANKTKTSILIADDGDRDISVSMYPHQEEWRNRRAMTMAEYEAEEMAMQILKHLGYDVFLRKFADSERWGDKTEQGMEIKDFHKYKAMIVKYLKINPDSYSPTMSINESKSECWADTETLVRVYQILIDSKVVMIDRKTGQASLNPNLYSEDVKVK